MKKYIAFDFDTNGYIEICVLKGKTKYQMDLVGVFQQGPFFVYEVEIG